jgi:hypothetical protein
MDEIHQPIPGYAASLSGPTNAVFDRLKSDRPFWRLNWTLIDDGELHQPTIVRRAPHADVQRWYFRVERQTLRRLDRTGAIVFTIHNYVASIAQLRDTPEFTTRLLKGIESAPRTMQEYKGWLGVAHALREALA